MALFMVFCSVVFCFHNPSVCLFIFVSFLYSDTLNTSKCIRLSNRSKLENTKVYCLFVSLECPTKLVAQNKGKQQQQFFDAVSDVVEQDLLSFVSTKEHLTVVVLLDSQLDNNVSLQQQNVSVVKEAK